MKFGVAFELERGEDAFTMPSIGTRAPRRPRDEGACLFDVLLVRGAPFDDGFFEQSYT